MARKFSKEEVGIITEALLTEGKKLFNMYGFQKTSIRELTEKVGIAQGTFYRFFDSKEQLFFSLLEVEEKTIRDKLFSAFMKDNQPARARFVTLLTNLLEVAHTNTLIRILYTEDTLKRISKRLGHVNLFHHITGDDNSFTTFVNECEKQGISFNERPEIIASMIRSLFLLTLHGKEIGEHIYEETIERFIVFTVNGLIKEG